MQSLLESICCRYPDHRPQQKRILQCAAPVWEVLSSSRKVVYELQKEADEQQHTDNLGDDQVNLKLSQERAEAVRQYLIDGGVAGDRVKAIGKGESEPKTTNETPEGRAMNRRVEVRLSETEKENVTKQRIKKNPNK